MTQQCYGGQRVASSQVSEQEVYDSRQKRRTRDARMAILGTPRLSPAI